MFRDTLLTVFHLLLTSCSTFRVFGDSYQTGGLGYIPSSIVIVFRHTGKVALVFMGKANYARVSFGSCLLSNDQSIHAFEWSPWWGGTTGTYVCLCRSCEMASFYYASYFHMSTLS